SVGFGYSNYDWPGYVTWGDFTLVSTRKPGAANYDEFNAHLGRVQQLMQTGRSRTDVGFVHQSFVHGMALGGGTGSDNTQMNWQFAHQGIHYRSTELQENGYTYDYLSPRFLLEGDVSFDQETKTIEQAGYRALVVYQDWLDLEAARKIQRWARQGLPVVILGDAASRTPYHDGNDRRLGMIMDQLRRMPTVRVAEVLDPPEGGYFSSAPGGYRDTVMEKLQELGVYPYTGYAEPNLQLLTQTRRDDDGNEYVYVYNYCPNDYHDMSHKPGIPGLDHGTHTRAEIVKDGEVIPHAIDARTGPVPALADSRWVDGTTVVAIELDFNNVALLAFEKVAREKLHVVSTDAESAYAVAGGVAVRAMRTGTVSTELSDGSRHDDDVTVPEPYEITG